MSWILGGDPIPEPVSRRLERSQQEVLHRSVTGNFSKDYVGEERWVITGYFRQIQESDLDTILNHYYDQVSNGTEKTLTIDGLLFDSQVIISISDENFDVAACYKYRTIDVTFHQLEPDSESGSS